ncbi:unnamed protein product, partial [marine sediment metagenome]
RDVINFKPDVTFITIGGNDANSGMALDEYRAAIEKIIDKLDKIDCLPILQTYYCPIYEQMSEIFQNFPEYMEIKRKISSERQIPLIDQYKYFSALYQNEKSTYSELMLDGLHVNPIGNAIMDLIACRSCYIPDPIFLDIKFEHEVQFYLDKMNRYLKLPPGCSFNPRCYTQSYNDLCKRETPHKIEVEEGHYIWCVNEEVLKDEFDF